LAGILEAELGSERMEYRLCLNAIKLRIPPFEKGGQGDLSG